MKCVFCLETDANVEMLTCDSCGMKFCRDCEPHRDDDVPADWCELCFEEQRAVSETMAPIPERHPLKIAWENYKKTEGFHNTRKWAVHEDHVNGSLWAAFMEGWVRGREHEFMQDAPINNLTEQDQVP